MTAQIKSPTADELGDIASPFLADKYEDSLRTMFKRSARNLSADATCSVNWTGPVPLKRNRSLKVARARAEDLAL